MHRSIILKWKMFTLLSLIVIVLFGIPQAFAQFSNEAIEAKIYLEYEERNVTEGSVVGVDVLIDSPSEINAISLNLLYESDRIQLVSYNTKESVIDIWKKFPSLISIGGTLMEGGASTPFSGVGNKVIRLNFETKKSGFINIRISSAKLLIADGFGTKQLANIISSGVFVSSSGVELINLQIQNDVEPPVLRNIHLTENPINDTRIITFQAVDRDTGAMQIASRIKKWFSWGEWSFASNPVTLASGVWSTQIQATDSRGNITVHTINDNKEILWKLFVLVLLISTVLLILLSILRYYKWYSKRTG